MRGTEMAKRYPNPRLVKKHRNYEIVEAADALRVHRHTVRRWIKDQGLEAITDRKPFLIRGVALQDFLTKKRDRRRVTCPPGHLYCMRCRTPRKPAGGFAEYHPLTGPSGRLMAICEACETTMYRNIRWADLPAFRRLVDVLLPEAELDIGDIAIPSLNSDFEEET